MEEQLYKKIEDMELKINEMYKIMTMVKKMFIWSTIITLFLFIVPLIILMFILPSMFNTLTSGYIGL